MTRLSERQSLTREEQFVALVHLYVELRLPFDAALDAAAADLFAQSDKGCGAGGPALRMAAVVGIDAPPFEILLDARFGIMVCRQTPR